MRIDPEEISNTGLKTIRTSHKNEFLIWQANTYDRASFMQVKTIFDEINEYFSQLSEQRKDNIWNTYKNINSLIYEMADVNFDNKINSIEERLQSLISELYEQLSQTDIVTNDCFYEIRKWVFEKSNIQIPKNFKDSYANNNQKERTYLIDDYRDLVVLAVATRVMVPIWGLYISAIKKDSGTNFKEILALKLMLKTKYILSPAIQKLRLFIESSIQAIIPEEATLASVINGIGTEILPDWILSQAIVRRISVGLISAPEEGTNIITNVYQHLDYTLKSIDTRFAGTSGRIVKKPTTTGNDSDGSGDNSSIVEMYKIKSAIPEGNIEILAHYFDNIENVAQKIDPSIDLEILNKCLLNIESQSSLQILEFQMTLCQWIMSLVVPSKAIPYLNKTTMNKVVACCQALLCHWGFFTISALLTAKPQFIEDNIISGNAENRTKVSKEHMELLIGCYPYFRPTKLHKVNNQHTNIAVICLNSICSKIYENNWFLLCHEELKYKVNSNLEVFSPDINLKNSLIELILKIFK